MASLRREYVPGVCNIGPDEVRLRQAVGWIGLVGTLALWATLVAARAAAGWRLLVFVPAIFGAIGFLQAAWHFCVGFGFGGVFNLGAGVGTRDTVAQAADRQQDRRTALKILGLASLIGGAVAAAAYFVPA